MKTAAFAVILLVGAAAFSGVAQADETTTAINQESARVAQHSAPTIWGAPVAESRSLSVPQQVAHTGAEGEHTGAVAQGDRFLFQLGDRGLGNN